MKKKKFTPRQSSTPMDTADWELLRSGMSEEDRSKLPPHDRSDRAHLFRYARKNKLFAASVLVIALLLLIGIIVGSVLLFQALTAPKDTQLQAKKSISLIYGEDDPIERSYEDLVRDDVFYLDLWELAEYFDLTVSGSQKRLRFTTPSDTYILVEHGAEYAVINGKRIRLEAEPVSGGDKVTAPARIEGKTCLVPYEILQSAVADGFSLKLNSKTNTLRIRPILNMVDDNKENAVPAEIRFTSDPFEQVILPIDKENMINNIQYPINIDPYLSAITAEHLVLANKSHALGKDYVPENLVALTCTTADSTKTYELNEDAANALYAMLAAMKADGVTDIYVTSAYRSYSYQESLFERYVKEHIDDGMSRAQAEAKAATYSSRAGESEHQTGLCIDFTTTSESGQLNESFETTPAFAWLSEHAWEYGFILRYPKGDEAITGYTYEPWHYRFVGRYAAAEIYQSNLTLEEYLGTAQ